MRKIDLNIEFGHDDNPWATIMFKDNLLIDYASSLLSLRQKMKEHLNAFHGIDNVEFEYHYNTTADLT